MKTGEASTSELKKLRCLKNGQKPAITKKKTSKGLNRASGPQRGSNQNYVEGRPSVQTSKEIGSRKVIKEILISPQTTGEDLEDVAGNRDTTKGGE